MISNVKPSQYLPFYYNFSQMPWHIFSSDRKWLSKLLSQKLYIEPIMPPYSEMRRDNMWIYIHYDFIQRGETTCHCLLCFLSPRQSEKRQNMHNMRNPTLWTLLKTLHKYSKWRHAHISFLYFWELWKRVAIISNDAWTKGHMSPKNNVQVQPYIGIAKIFMFHSVRYGIQM